MCMHARFLLCKIEELMETVTLELTKSLSCASISFFLSHAKRFSCARESLFVFFANAPLGAP